MEWLQKSGKSLVDVGNSVDQIAKDYKATSQVPSHVRRELGIGVLQSSDRTLDFQISGRLSDAEGSFKNGVFHISVTSDGSTALFSFPRRSFDADTVNPP